MRYRNQTQGAANVVVIGVGSDGMGMIRECLGTEAVLPTQSTPYGEAEQVVQKIRPNVIIIGFDQSFRAAVDLGTRLIADIPGIQLIAISEQADPEWIRSAMRSGYREYVVLPEDADRLRQTVHEAAYGTNDPEDMGEVVAVVGSKGGSGCTLLTINLAAELSALHSTCVVDFDFSMGDVASFLDLQPNNSLADLFQNLHRLDARMLRGSVSLHPPSGVHILPQPTDLSLPEPMRTEDVLRILSFTAEAYQYVLVDCGTHVDVATMTAIEAADLILLVCSPDVASVRDVWRKLQLLKQHGIEASVIRLVLNNWERNAELSDELITQNLKIPIAARIHQDPTCQAAVRVGKLIRDVKRTQASEDIAAAASLITEGAEQIELQQPKRPFGWLFK